MPPIMTSVSRRWRTWCRQACPGTVPITRIPIWRLLVRGGTPSTDGIGEIFAAVGHPSAATAPALAALREDILDASRYVVFDDVIPSLERAKAAGWRNLIVSNHIPELAELVHGLDLTRHFDAIISSGVVGYEKPHRRLFEAALRHVHPGETVWMIGDNPDADCRPVCELGMKAVLVRGARPGQFEREARGLSEALDLIL